MNNLQRYDRQIKLNGFGRESQQKLWNAKVLVVGAGGLGIPVLQYLAAMGVGTLGIMDGDIISLSNLNRQVLYTEDEAELQKVEVAAKKLHLQNPSVNIASYNEHLTVNNALEIVRDYDLIIDATDNYAARYLINDACVILNKPFIYGAIYQFEGHVSVFNFEDGPTYRCLYSAPPNADETADCNEAGVLGIVPGLIGCQQALEAVKVITGIGKSLSGVLQIHDFLNNEQYKLKLKAIPENKRITQLQKRYEIVCDSPISSVDVNKLHQWYLEKKEFQLVDVRETDEFQKVHLTNSQCLPLSTFRASINTQSTKLPIVVLCKQGQRSKEAVRLLKERSTVIEAYSLEGGLDRWLKEIGDKFVQHG